MADVDLLHNAATLQRGGSFCFPRRPEDLSAHSRPTLPPAAPPEDQDPSCQTSLPPPPPGSSPLASPQDLSGEETAGTGTSSSGLQGSGERAGLPDERVDCGEEESTKHNTGIRTPSSERRDPPSRPRSEDRGEEEAAEERRAAREGTLALHPHPCPVSGFQTTPGSLEDRPDDSDHSETERDDNGQGEPLHRRAPSQSFYHPEDLTQSRGHSQGVFHPQHTSPRWRDTPPTDFYEHFGVPASHGFPPPSSRHLGFNPPRQFKREPEETLDLSSHGASTSNNVHAREHTRNKEGVYHLSSERERLSSFPFSEGQALFSPTRDQLPETERSQDCSASQEPGSFSPTQIHVSRRDCSRELSAGEALGSFSPTKVPMPVSSSSSPNPTGSGELGASFSEPKPFPSSCSPSTPTPSPPHSLECSSAAWSPRDCPPHDAVRKRRPSASSAFHGEEGLPTSSASFFHPHLGSIPLSTAGNATFPGGWPPFQGMMLPGGMGGPVSRFAVMPSLGSPPAPPPAPSAAAVAAAAAAAAAAAGASAGPASKGDQKCRVFCCHLCAFTGSTKDEFDSHMAVHFKFSCSECGYRSRTEGRLLKHIKDFHSIPNEHRVTPSRPKLFRCKQCAFSSTDRIENWRHRRHHIKEEKRLQCPQCPFVTEYKHHLEYHLHRHFNSRPYKCSKCNYSCVNKSMLNSHMKSHTKACQFRCADCSFAAKYSHSIKIHLQKHNHRLGAVLNSDGSLPQYDMPKLCGGGKKAAHRSGPKEGDFSAGGFVPGFFPVSPSPGIPHPMPGLNPVLPNGMYPFPFWAAMANSQHPPPPLVDMRSLGGPGRPATSMSSKMEEFHSPSSDQDGAPRGSWERDSYACNRCAFTCDTAENLHRHMVKVHTSDSADYRNPQLSSHSNSPMYNPRHPAVSHASTSSSTGCQTSSQGAADEMGAGRSSHPSTSYSRYGSEADCGRSPNTAGFTTYGRQQFSEYLHRENKEDYKEARFPDRQKGDEKEDAVRHCKPRLNQQPDHDKGSGQGMNIIQQMTQRFGCAATTSSLPFTSQPSAAQTHRPMDQGERAERDPSELEQKSASPMGQQPSPIFSQNTPAENPCPGAKRAHEDTADPDPHPCDPSANEPFFQPRKRSRKGKAFKLDTLYLKRQEQQLQLESMGYMDEDSRDTKMKESDNSENGTERNLKHCMENVLEKTDYNSQYKTAPANEHEHFKQLQKDIQMLNNDPSHDNPMDLHQQSPEDVFNEVNEPPSTETQDTGPEKAASSDTLPASAQAGEDPEKERESLIQLVCMNRRRPVPPPLRRGSEVAWKMMNDLGLKLPPEALAQASQDEKSNDAPTSSAPCSPPTGASRHHSFSEAQASASFKRSPPAGASRHHSFSEAQASASFKRSPPVGASRHHSFSEAQALASFKSHCKTRRMSLPWSTSSPYTLTSSRLENDSGSAAPSSEATVASLPSKEIRTIPSHQDSSPWMKLNMQLTPFHYKFQSTANESSQFHRFSFRSSTSSQTVGKFPVSDFMLGTQNEFVAPPPPSRPYPAPFVGRSHECQYCEMSFKDETQYSMHMWFHQTGNPFECRGCGCVSDNKVDFYRHLVTMEHI